MTEQDIFAAALMCTWLALVGVGLWRDLPAWIADAESEDDR